MVVVVRYEPICLILIIILTPPNEKQVVGLMRLGMSEQVN